MSNANGHDDEQQPTDLSGSLEHGTERDLRVFVGPNADFYLRRWTPRLLGQDRDTGKNIAAFFCPTFWLGCRRLYGVLLILFGVMAIDVVLEFALIRANINPNGLGFLVVLILCVVCGVCGNGWYLTKAQRAIAEVRAQGLDGEAGLRAISYRGGINVVAGLGSFVLFPCAAGLLVKALSVLWPE
jgi:hypothetical protein